MDMVYHPTVDICPLWDTFILVGLTNHGGFSYAFGSIDQWNGKTYNKK